MLEEILNRPSRRSAPVSQLVRLIDTANNQKQQNVEQVKPISTKHKLESLVESFHSTSSTHTSTPLAKRSRHIISNETGLKTPVSDLVKQSPTTAFNVLDLTPSKQKSSFKIFQDMPLKKPQDDTSTNPTIKVSEIPIEFEAQGETGACTVVPFQFKISSNVDESSLSYQFQLPILHLDNWYKIHRFNILEQEHEEKESALFEVLNVSKLNDLLLLVKVKDATDTEEEVLLINYRQIPSTFSKVMKLKRGDKIVLRDGSDVLGKYKLYRYWKLMC